MNHLIEKLIDQQANRSTQISKYQTKKVQSQRKQIIKSPYLHDIVFSAQAYAIKMSIDEIQNEPLKIFQALLWDSFI